MADIAKYIEKADKYLQRGKAEDALAELKNALDEEPENTLVRERACDICISLNRQREATSYLSSLLDRYFADNDQTRAIVTYKKLTRISSATVAQTFRYAQLIEKTNRREALELLQKAASGFEAGGKIPEAMQVLRHIVTLEPTLENFKRQGELATAAGDGKTAAMAFYQVGMLEENEKRDGTAWYERAYTMDTSNADIAHAFGRCLLLHGDAPNALKVIEAFAKLPNSSEALRETYARALLRLKRPKEAEPIILSIYEKDPKQINEVALLIGTLLEIEHDGTALTIAKRTVELEDKAGRHREFVGQLKEIVDKHRASPEFLEYMVMLFNSTNREQDYCSTLLKLFELYYAAGNYLKAADSLDAAAEVDPYESGHQKRLEMLKGKIDANRHRAIANRFTAAVKVSASAQREADEEAARTPSENEPTVLEDFMLQAEIFLQYSMRSKAVERLQRIQKLFPREEERNEKLRTLYMNAGMMPKYDTPAPPPAKAAAAPPPPAAETQRMVPPTVALTNPSGAPQMTSSAAANENSVDNIARVTEITRNIYRQANVKAVLFAAVNDVGRHWGASRCVAGLCTPGKPPSAALEYCAPGVKQSDVMAIVKLIGTLQGLASGQGSIAIQNVKNAPELASIKQWVDALGIDSVLAVPLLDGEEHVGILILEQCGTSRPWRQTDVLVLKTIADQMVLAVNNAKLRNLMKTLAVTDEKSGLLKRASYLDVLLAEIRRGLQQNSPASVMLLHFGRASNLIKEIGELAVESMMQQLGQICCSHIRQNDVAVRYDTTSIALVLADTNEKNAFFVVDKLRKVLNTVKVPGTDRSVACSVGIAEAVMQARFDPVDIVTEAINRVERALDVAKHEGGNKAKSLAPQLEAAAVA
ncbi:MAG TPA: diguanylate cyclase [Terriglobales bacterium]|nr:diguanylate cyclase [Terriglobales bacterium]